MPMKYLVAVLAWLMPVVAWLSNTGLFGPTNGAISDRYPTLVVAAGYAFAIWGPIFLLDVVHGTWQLFDRAVDARTRAIRPYTAVAFAMTSAWMVVFSLQWFWLALAIIWISLACLLVAVFRVARTRHHAGGPWWQWMPLSLHAGWLSLAVFLDLAQVIVAYHLLPTRHMLPWSLVLFAALAILLLWVLARLRGNGAYALAAVWGLVGVFVKQHAYALPGAQVASWVALGLAVVVVIVSGVMLRRRVRGAPARPA